MFRLVQQYGSQGFFTHTVHTVDLIPVPSLVEDDDGARLILCGDLLPVPAWTQGLGAGARGVLNVAREPLYAPIGVYGDRMTLNPFTAAYGLATPLWTSVTVGSWRQMEAQVAAQSTAPNPFVHLHTHSEFSALDGYSTVDEIVTAVTADNQTAIGLTDHGVVAGHPALHKATLGTSLKPIYGCEANFVDDRHSRENPGDYWHLVLWAQDDEGLRNLWALSTEGYRDGFYSRPRIDWDTLSRLKTGLIVSTACLRGPVLEPYLSGDEPRAIQNLHRLGEIFGDRLYLELHTNHLSQQKAANSWLIDMSAKYSTPLLAAVDSHYSIPEHKDAHRAWLAMQTKKDVSDETSLFSGGQDYHLMTVTEVRTALDYLPQDIVKQAISNTSTLAAQCTAKIVPKVVMPVYSRPTKEHPDPVRHDAERMVDDAQANWKKRIDSKVPAKDQQPYIDAFTYQCNLIIAKKYPGYFLMTADYVTWAKDHGVLVGPARGSGANCIVAYLLRITEIDPIEADLLFSRFLTEGRNTLPDFDIDFPSSKSEIVLQYNRDRWGEDHVARVGTIIRIKNKSAFKDVERSISSRLPEDSFSDVVKISKIIDQAESTTAGLGLSWSELFAQEGDLLEPYRDKMPELFALAEQFRGRVKNYSKHAAGIIIDPDESLVDSLPMRKGSDGESMVTQFDMDSLDYLGKIKFDFLMVSNLDIIQDAIDLVKKNKDFSINVYDWQEEYSDPAVYEELSAGWTLGLFQIETPIGTQTTMKVKPTNRSEMSDIIALGRPGPMRSGLDKIYLRRRSGEEKVQFSDPRLEKVLWKTFGTILYQEDVMAICSTLAGYNSNEADAVRRILGKKKVDLVEAEGHKFIERAVDNHTDRAVAIDLWVQMAEFARYSFPKGHSYSYATLSYWGGWIKTHFPKEFLLSAMKTIDKDKIPKFVSEARRLGYNVLPPDINESKVIFDAVDLTIRYGLSVPGVGEIGALAAIEGQPYKDYDDFLERKGPRCNMGHVKILARIGAFDQIAPHRRALEYRISTETSGTNTRCVDRDDTFINAFDLPCHFDWSSEEPRIGRSGKLLKNQPVPPKLCTRRCRHYRPVPPPDYSRAAPYTKAEIRDIEHSLLGIYLSSTPFDVFSPNTLNEAMTADDLTVVDKGRYPVIGLIAGARPDSKGRPFGFLEVDTPAGSLSAIVFSRLWNQHKHTFITGRIILATIDKTDQDRYRLATSEVF